MESKKLKPSKQALADAIHQNGGWVDGGNWAVQDKAHAGVKNKIVFYRESKPEAPIAGGTYWRGNGVMAPSIEAKNLITNWHQTILSRDEYFTAYPEQVKAHVVNETNHKVAVEVKSESEATVKVSDWHKNGELPPAGAWCTLHAKENNGEEVMFIGVTSCNSPVFETVQNMIFVERGEFRFSPLRTERERAIDEMIKVINRYDYYGSLNFDVVASDIANAMFDEGFRKEVK